MATQARLKEESDLIRGIIDAIQRQLGKELTDEERARVEGQVLDGASKEEIIAALKNEPVAAPTSQPQEGQPQEPQTAQQASKSTGPAFMGYEGGHDAFLADVTGPFQTDVSPDIGFIYDTAEQYRENLGRGGRNVRTLDYRNVGQFINSIANMRTDELIAWQKRLEKAGYLDEGKYRIGFYDDNTTGAFLNAIHDARTNNISLLDALQKSAAGEKARLKAEKDAANARASISFQEQAEDQYRNQLLSVYMKTWGLAPPPGYIDKIVASGMNFYEFESHERAKPSFEASPRYQQDRVSIERQLAQDFGALG